MQAKFNSKEHQNIFAVLDGHGQLGEIASGYTREMFPDYVSDYINENADPD